MTDKVKEVTIIGRAASGMALPPRGGHKWGLNCVYRWHDDLDKIFFMHEIDAVHDGSIEAAGSLADVEDKIPVVTLENYPLKAITDELGDTYFVCTISYMIALAIYKKYDKIYVDGCDFAWGDTDHAFVKRNVEYWIGYARGRGIEVIIHPISTLCKPHPLVSQYYGYNRDEFVVEDIPPPTAEQVRDAVETLKRMSNENKN